MKKLFIAWLMIAFVLIPLKSADMSLAVYSQIGKTIVNKWNAVPVDTSVIQSWHNNYSGYFFQLLLHVRKARLGIEYAKNTFYDYYVLIREASLAHTQLGGGDTYIPGRVLALIQYNLKHGLLAEAGFGTYLKKHELGRSEESHYTGMMFSLRYHFMERNSNFEIPVFIRADINFKEGTPIAISAGFGVVFKINI